MIIDSRLEFSVGQTVSASDPSTNIIDLSSGRDIGPGTPMWVVVVADAATAADVTVSLQTSAASGSGFATIATVLVPDETEVGAHFVLGVPFKNERYLRLLYSAAGKFSAFLTDQEPVSWQAYPGVA